MYTHPIHHLYKYIHINDGKMREKLSSSFPLYQCPLFCWVKKHDFSRGNARKRPMGTMEKRCKLVNSLIIYPIYVHT